MMLVVVVKCITLIADALNVPHPPRSLFLHLPNHYLVSYHLGNTHCMSACLIKSNFCLKVIYNAHCVDFRKAAWCGTISGRQPGVGQEVIRNARCVGFRKAAWCGTGSNTQPPLCWFQEDSLVWDNPHCFDFRKAAWCGTMPTV